MATLLWSWRDGFLAATTAIQWFASTAMEEWEPDTAAVEEALNRDADREQWAKRIEKKHERLTVLHKSDHSEVWLIRRKRKSASTEEETKMTRRREEQGGGTIKEQAQQDSILRVVKWDQSSAASMFARHYMISFYKIGPPGMYFPACYKKSGTSPTFHSTTMDYIDGKPFCPDTLSAFQQQLRQILQVGKVEGKSHGLMKSLRPLGSCITLDSVIVTWNLPISW